MTDIQTVVIGAGVVGLAVARQLAMSGREVCVLEAEAAIGQGTSSRNSEVIHAGIYYPQHSQKAMLCVDGRQRLYAYCREHHISHKKCGKLIVATSDDEVNTLQTIQQKALNNGVDDIKLIDADTAISMQPQLHCKAALHSPSTGIIDSHSLMVSLQGNIENLGGTIACRAPVESIEVQAEKFCLTVGGESAMQLSCKELINCAGLNAIALANQTHLHNKRLPSLPQAQFAKGNYFRLQGRTPFSMLIYPAPVSGGLGVHLTLDTAGQARFGPDVQWLESNTPFDYQVDASRSQSFYQAIRKYWPALPDNSLQPDYAGIRPKIKDNTDFQISTAADHGVSGLVNLFGIESPGLTSALAIAASVAQSIH